MVWNPAVLKKHAALSSRLSKGFVFSARAAPWCNNNNNKCALPFPFPRVPATKGSGHVSTPSLSNEKPIFRRPLLPGFGLSRHLLRFSSLGYLNASHRFSFSPCSAFHFGTTVLEARAGGRMDGWMEKRRSGQRSGSLWSGEIWVPARVDRIYVVSKAASV